VSLWSVCIDDGAHPVMLCVDVLCVSDACAGTFFEKCTIPWKSADGLLRIHSLMDEHCIGRLGPHQSRALEMLELG